MSIKYICDVCGRDVEESDYKMLDFREETFEFSPANFDSIAGHKGCMEQVKDRISELLSKSRAE